MRLKSILLASSGALSLIAAAPASAEGFYVSTFGGANWMRDEDTFFQGKRSTSVFVHFESDTGFVLGGAVGLELDHWLHGLKFEIETSFRHNDLGGHWTSEFGIGPNAVNEAAIFSGSIDGTMSTFAVMSNAWYEFDIGYRFKPYFGGGVGWARTQVDGVFVEPGLRVTAAAIDPFEGFHLENSGFAYQLGAGINSQIMPGVSLGLGYRFFDGPNNEFFIGGLVPTGLAPLATTNGDGHVKFDNVEQSVILSLSIDVN